MSRQIKTRHPRSLAALICDAVIHQGKSLNEAIDSTLHNLELSTQDRGFIHSLSFGVVRWYWQLEDELQPLLKKPIKTKERLVKYILLIGIFQIQHLQTPAHAAVSDTVKCCQQLGKQWAKNLVNACLRNYLRKQESTVDTEFKQHPTHPQWMLELIQQAWPQHQHAILSANNQAAPLCLRVNQKTGSTANYLDLLKQADIPATQDPFSPIGIRIAHSLPVNTLPKFAEGWVSVQDSASQLIAQFISVEKQQRVLDACAAPGGKTSLILENSDDDIVMHALDVNAERNHKLHSTLKRLKLDATIIAGDASKPEDWWDGEAYQRILIDAPCSGLGVIRRHPDIKHLRQIDDLDTLYKTQEAILDACWQLLGSHGLMLYTTCSILPQENEQQIERFLARTTNAEVIPIDHPTAIKLTHGRQTLPGVSEMDGFYYCLIHKLAE